MPMLLEMVEQRKREQLKWREGPRGEQLQIESTSFFATCPPSESTFASTPFTVATQVIQARVAWDGGTTKELMIGVEMRTTRTARRDGRNILELRELIGLSVDLRLGKFGKVFQFSRGLQDQIILQLLLVSTVSGFYDFDARRKERFECLDDSDCYDGKTFCKNYKCE
ncbi:hypothetical protein GCK72_001098 [Caenorhabditis remanei]|uniref:Uncharacterized protein n=1 Tax=Caenorhabditis remanei TaxID=31234 RepID=A0A6A5HU28_CAERE|nr:hypothetical protein GCK72_001098 [Caenorhabditis remanei]KAF1769282.1 hypothetical protein GCK72_001098 [Caenorhabditis remanei]